MPFHASLLAQTSGTQCPGMLMLISFGAAWMPSLAKQKACLGPYNGPMVGPMLLLARLTEMSQLQMPAGKMTELPIYAAALLRALFCNLQAAAAASAASGGNSAAATAAASSARGSAAAAASAAGRHFMPEFNRILAFSTCIKNAHIDDCKSFSLSKKYKYFWGK